MSEQVYRVMKVRCTRCNDEKLLDVMYITEQKHKEDPKVRNTGDDKWKGRVNCDCGNVLSDETRFWAHGFEVVETVDSVQADELDEQEPDFSIIFELADAGLVAESINNDEGVRDVFKQIKEIAASRMPESDK